MSEALTMPISEPVYTIGLLGARITMLATAASMQETRLQEIERRILAIEARMPVSRTA